MRVKTRGDDRFPDNLNAQWKGVEWNRWLLEENLPRKAQLAELVFQAQMDELHSPPIEIKEPQPQLVFFTSDMLELVL